MIRPPRYGLFAAAAVVAAVSAAAYWWEIQTAGRSAPEALAATDHQTMLPPPAAPPETVPAPAPPPDDPLAAALRAENRALQIQLDNVYGWILTNVQGCFPLPAVMLSYLDFPAATTDDRLPADLVAWLRITPEEQLAMEQSYAVTRLDLDALAMARAEVSLLEGEAAEVLIPPFPDEGAVVRNQLLADADRILGAYRSARFQQTAGRDLERRFAHFGDAERRIRMTLEAAEAPETAPRLRILDSWSRTDEDGVTRVESTEWATGEPPDAYQPFMRLILDATATARDISRESPAVAPPETPVPESAPDQE